LPFEVTVDDKATLAQFDALQKRLADLENKVPETFIHWQTEDMHRHFPKLDGSGLSVSTSIYPRGIHHDRGGAKRGKSLTGGKPRPRRSIIGSVRGAHRPILRPELFEKLKERMVEMCKAALTWR
jgi:hypothetical protein